MRHAIILSLGVCVLASCQIIRTGGPEAPEYAANPAKTANSEPTVKGPVTPQSNDVAVDPVVLANRGITLAQMRFNGVRIGDSRSTIPRSRIRDEAPDLVNCTDGFSYDIDGDKVIRVFIYNETVLQRLGTATAEDLVRVFGQPDKTESKPVGRYTVYYFRGGAMKINFFPDLSKVGDIYISYQAGDFAKE